MDFSNVFVTMPQQQQSFAKPNEDNTSGFFFGDEGIDTTGSFVDPTVFATPSQDMGYLSQSLAMDNTMSNASIWSSHLTPESLILNSFPTTPTQPLDMFQPSFSSSLGKRSLQLDVEDFPQSKRHESMRDYTTLSSFSSTSSPQMEVVSGLSDEAADVCATWFNKYAVLPSDRHVESLSQLTGESSDAIRQWFGRLLKQGMGGHDSAYKSQTDMMQPTLCWSDSYTADLVSHQQQPSSLVQHQPTTQLTQEDTATPERRPSNDTATISQSTSNLRGGKKRCTPTDNRELLSRDPNKIYQCTRKCGKRYGRKCDWKRNEEEGYPCKSWVCSLCIGGGVENVRPCFRKYHFVQHFRNIHPDVDSDQYEQTSIVCSETEFPRNCGFCKDRFDSRQDRIDHIADHFKQGKSMLDWNDNSDDDGQDDDDNNDDDDDDDKPSGDGYDSAPSQPPPERDPRDDFNSKYHGGGDYGGGGNSNSPGSLPPSSFFQLQLSSELEDVDITKRPQGDRQSTQQRSRSSRSSSEPKESSSLQERVFTKQCSTQQHASTARDDEPSLAGDALSGLLVGGTQVPSQPLVARGVCLSKDGVGLITAAANRQPAPLDSDNNAPGRNTKISPTEGLTQHHSKDQCVATPIVQDATVGQTKVSLSSMAVLDTVHDFTPHSFLSVRLLGAGGFSTVDEVLHRATKLRLGRKTLKNRNQSAIEELKKEVSVLQKLRHPHVIRFLGAYSNGDKMSILVSPVAETTLALWLEQGMLQQPANFVNVVSKMFGCLLSSVRYLHEQRPVVKHMDIKPQNILVVQGDQEFPHIVLCDFGVSSSDDLSDGQHKPLTRRYVAPEVLEGLTREQAADIWSLGCVFAEMASAPFAQSNSKWLTFRHEYSGRAGKHYWQDVPSLQNRLSSFLEEAATPTEKLVVGTLKDMLHADPNERPSAALLSLRFTPAPCCLEWSNDKAVFPAPDQELEAVENLGHRRGVDCCDHLDHAAGIIDDHSQDVFKNAKRWIEECSHAHEACRQHAKTDRTLPTRLVDTQPEGIDNSIVRVVDSTSITQGSEGVEYATLSYVWEQTGVTLTTDELQKAQLGFQRHALPKPLESGIQAAQNLGYRYIWIDSLCVLQDSEDDKRSECAKMASVFRNAALTIVLDQIDEFRSEKPAITEITSGVLPNAMANALTQNANKTGDRPSAAAILPVSDFATPGFGWDTRAWALQERLLSHRLLHLCDMQMYWECNSLKASDTFPQGLSPLLWEKAHSKSHHDRPQCGKSGVQSVTFKNVLGRPTLEPTRLRNCQWIHKEGNGNSDSMTAAHTTMQLEGAKAPLSSKAVLSPDFARKIPAIDAISTTNASIRAYNTGDDQVAANRSASPYLKGLFALSSGHLTSAHRPLSKVYRRSDSINIGLSAGSLPVHVVGAIHDQPANNSSSHTSSTHVAQPNAPQNSGILATANTACDSLVHTLAHQLVSEVYSHPCTSPNSSPKSSPPPQIHSHAPSLQT
ncbi:uncharacterized protein EKO05_0003835 [Ascochyta rabiei]|nr:uncharacterized protein EKO05_0003835 [Ascochyta rabiei]UPX13319.1 hypothetical protein EKO05_0003835 [Ascochyta rabiei]